MRRVIRGSTYLLLFMAVTNCGGRESARARDQLTQFRSSLQLSSTQRQVEELLHSSATDRLELVKQSSEIWIVTTPYQFGASNWWLYLTFANTELVEIKVRTEDSAGDHPQDAPPDLVRK